MDIDLIESTFNELMGELEKIKDLNELAESYQKKTQVLSEQLERFLSASAEGRNIMMEKILSVEDALKSINENRLPELRDSFKEEIDDISQKAEEYQNSNADSFKSINTSLSHIVQEAAKSASDIREFEEKAFEAQSKLSGLISEKIDGVHRNNGEFQSSLHGVIKKVHQSNAKSLDDNLIAIKRGHLLNYIQITLTLIVIALIALILFSK